MESLSMEGVGSKRVGNAVIKHGRGQGRIQDFSQGGARFFRNKTFLRN